MVTQDGGVITMRVLGALLVSVSLAWWLARALWRPCAEARRRARVTNDRMRGAAWARAVLAERGREAGEAHVLATCPPSWHEEYDDFDRGALEELRRRAPDDRL